MLTFLSALCQKLKMCVWIGRTTIKILLVSVELESDEICISKIEVDISCEILSEQTLHWHRRWWWAMILNRWFWKWWFYKKT